MSVQEYNQIHSSSNSQNQQSDQQQHSNYSSSDSDSSGIAEEDIFVHLSEVKRQLRLVLLFIFHLFIFFQF